MLKLFNVLNKIENKKNSIILKKDNLRRQMLKNI